MTFRKFRRDAKGATAVEFALTAPVFIAMIFGVIEFGLLLWTQVGMQAGVETAARCATVNPGLCADTGSIQNYASQHSLGLNLSPSAFTFGKSTCGNKVSASYAFPMLMTYFPSASMQLSAQACFPV